MSAVSWRVLLPTLYPEGVVPLSDVADKFFGVSLERAQQMAARHELPCPAVKLGSKKSPWMVPVDDLLHLVESRSSEAREKWQTLNDVA